MNLTSLLKVARISLGLSLYELSKMTGISEKTLKNYEEEAIEPDLPRSIIICHALQIPLTEVNIKEEDCLFTDDDITYTKKYFANIDDVYYFGKCKCGRSYYIKEEDIHNHQRTKCKACTVKDINESSTFFSNLDSEDISRLDTMFQNRIVKRSVKLGVNCTINLQDYLQLIRQNCYYCGKKPTQEDIINGKVFIHNGIDRLDNHYGYEEGNIVPCCTECNMAKGSLDSKEFIELVRNIYENRLK